VQSRKRGRSHTLVDARTSTRPQSESRAHSVHSEGHIEQFEIEQTAPVALQVAGPRNVLHG